MNNRLFLSFTVSLLILFVQFCNILTLFGQQPSKVHRSCGTDAIFYRQLANDPSYRRRHEAMEQRIFELTQHYLNKPVTHRTSEDAILTIPVVFHIIYQEEENNLSLERIERAIRNLNAGFRNAGEFDRGSGADIKIQFCLAQTDPNGQPTDGITRHQSELASHMPGDLTIKNNWNWNPLQYLNFYVVEDAFLAAGYSSLPSSHGRVDDGIVLVAAYVGLDSAEVTITHEVGHYFNLLHPFQGECPNSNCLLDGDKVCDTPPQREPGFSFSCQPTNSCSTDADDRSDNNPFKTDGNDAVTLFMDYRDNLCLHDFSEGQKLRMRLAASLVRQTSWSFPDVCRRPSTACVAPSNIRTVRASDGRLTVNWTTAPGVNSYEVTAVDARTMATVRVIVQGTSWVQPAVPADALLLLRVRSICGTDSSAYANAAFAGEHPIYCESNRVINAPNGTITDGSGPYHYSPNTSCGWQIRVPNGPRIRFDLDSLLLDLQTSDFVAIFDGPNASAPLIAQFDGRNLPANPIVTSGTEAFVYFESDELIEEQGWQLRFRETNEPAQAQIYCQGLTRLTAPSGTIDDGSGPSKYGINLDCEWLITGQPGEVIQFQFPQLLISDFMDVITIYDGADKNAPVLASSSFDIFNPSTAYQLIDKQIYRSNGHQILVHFETNEKGIDQGWEMNYKSIPIDNVPPGGCAALTTVTAPAGTISDGSGWLNWYETDIDCRWLVRVPDTDVIQLRFNYAGLGSEQDSVIVYDGPDAQSPVLIYYTGADFERRLVRSTNNVIFVVFKSRGLMGAEGWEFDYESVARTMEHFPDCPPLTTINTASGIIEYGNKVIPYGPNLDCRWRFSAPDSGNYFFSFNRLNLNWNQQDTLFLYDGPTTSDSLLLQITGTSPGGYSARSTGPEALLVFKSSNTINPEIQGTGWSLYYSTETQRPIRPFCEGITTLTAPVGTITDGSGPELYTPNSDCRWLIDIADSVSIAFQVEQLQTRRGGRVLVYDGPTEASPLILWLDPSKIVQGFKFISSGPKALVVFSSPTFSRDQGFELSYRAIPRRPSSRFTCAEEVDVFSPTDTLTDGSGPHPYSNDLKCTWTIFGQGSNRIRLQFVAFDTEPIWDKVKVYDGRIPTESSLLGEFSGAELPQTVMFTSDNTATIEFTTDANSVGQGWALAYAVGQFTGNAEQLAALPTNPYLTLYPNPTTGRFNIRYPIHPTSAMQLEMFDLMGRLVWFQELPADVGEAAIEWQATASGIYLCRLRIDGQPAAHQKLMYIHTD